MRRGLILGILLAFIVTAAWWFLFMSGKSSEISEFEDETATARIEQASLESRKAELEALAAREGDYLLALSEIQNSIPAFPDGAALIEDINEIAVDVGVELITLSPSPPAPVANIEGLYGISTTLNFTAPYFKVLQVLFALEDMERLVRVDQITIGSDLDESGENILTVNLTATAFSLSDLAIPIPVGADDEGAGGDSGESGGGSGGDE